MVSLDNLVKMNESVSPPAIYRYNQAYSATISATPAAGVSLGEAIKKWMGSLRESASWLQHHARRPKPGLCGKQLEFDFRFHLRHRIDLPGIGGAV
jgi:hypothetical protein